MQTEKNLPLILIVDDEKIIADVLADFLKTRYRIVVARDGLQALRILEKPPFPDLILLDIVMPSMDGYSVCRKIKSQSALRAIPVIFITAKTEAKDEALGFAAGAADYITKPFRPLIVQARVKTHIELKQKRDMLERLADLDGLTGIPNRRRFEKFLSDEWSRCLRYRHAISLILLDIDFFKAFNDHYGHPEGDECLKRVAAAFGQAVSRNQDLVARYGGEEFVCALPETGEEGAMAVANRILEHVRSLAIPHATSSVAPHVTVSMGVATYHPQAPGLASDLVISADRALYQAKKEGRNRIVRQSELIQTP